jgi:hypothetical protein
LPQPVKAALKRRKGDYAPTIRSETSALKGLLN